MEPGDSTEQYGGLGPCTDIRTPRMGPNIEKNKSKEKESGEEVWGDPFTQYHDCVF
jgi:hypothetical protein